MPQSLWDELMARRQQHALSDELALLVLAACDSAEALRELVGAGTAPVAPVEAADDGASEPQEGVFLHSLAVEGFRGIGPEATLSFQPGPGLTLVVGRNGSGKSSFAEALELLVTGDSLRWAKPRTAAWRQDWANIHHAKGTHLAARFSTSGHELTTVERRWAAGDRLEAGFATAQEHGKPLQKLAELGWSEGLRLYRPFLSYSELGSILVAGPSKLFDALSSVLGVEEMDAVANRLDSLRKEIDGEVEECGAQATRLLERLKGVDDPRAAEAAEALAAGAKADLGALERLATASSSLEGEGDLPRLRALAAIAAPDLVAVGEAAAELRAAAAAVAGVTGTDADAARETASLLEAALLHQHRTDDEACPVCGRSGALDDAWRSRTEARVTELRAAAASSEQVHRAYRAASQALLALFAPVPEVLDDDKALEAWEHWLALKPTGDLPAASVEPLCSQLEEAALRLGTELASVRKSAEEDLARLESVWRPVATEIAGWVFSARAVQRKAPAASKLQLAARWVRTVSVDARNDRFAPIAERAKATWNELRCASNVQLDEIEFQGTSTNRHIELDVKVDGVPGAALGVMSQGELHALALSLFLPRAMMAQSPFRYMIIDDPVQSMDPARVDGLARVLEGVAKTHQVVVFTHDDRLPDAVRRLGMPGRILEVTRRLNSEVEIRNALDPSRRALDDARALVNTAHLPAGLAAQVVPGLCRTAVEACCADILRRRRLSRGESHQLVEDVLMKADQLRPRVSLALFDEPSRPNDDIRLRLRQFGPRSVDAYFRCLSGGHQVDSGDLLALVGDVETLVNDLRSVS